MLWISWISWIGCAADLPDGWEDAVPVESLELSRCAGLSEGTAVGSALTVDADLAADPLTVQVGGIGLRCEQEVDAFWKQDGSRVDVLVQPVDLDPRTVPKCDCRYDLDIVVGSPDPTAGQVVVYQRQDAYGGDAPTPPQEIGRAP